MACVCPVGTTQGNTVSKWTCKPGCVGNPTKQYVQSFDETSCGGSQVVLCNYVNYGTMCC